MKKTSSNSIKVSGRIFFFLVLSLFIAEQISSYHFPLGECLELTDSEEGEQEKEAEEKEKKEFVLESYKLIYMTLNEQDENRDNSFSKLLITHLEVFTPPPKS